MNTHAHRGARFLIIKNSSLIHELDYNTDTVTSLKRFYCAAAYLLTTRSAKFTSSLIRSLSYMPRAWFVLGLASCKLLRPHLFYFNINASCILSSFVNHIDYSNKIFKRSASILYAPQTNRVVISNEKRKKKKLTTTVE